MVGLWGGHTYTFGRTLEWEVQGNLDCKVALFTQVFWSCQILERGWTCVRPNRFRSSTDLKVGPKTAAWHLTQLGTQPGHKFYAILKCKSVALRIMKYVTILSTVERPLFRVKEGMRRDCIISSFYLRTAGHIIHGE